MKKLDLLFRLTLLSHSKPFNLDFSWHLLQSVEVKIIAIGFYVRMFNALKWMRCIFTRVGLLVAILRGEQQEETARGKLDPFCGVARKKNLGYISHAVEVSCVHAYMFVRTRRTGTYTRVSMPLSHEEHQPDRVLVLFAFVFLAKLFFAYFSESLFLSLNCFPEERR